MSIAMPFDCCTFLHLVRICICQSQFLHVFEQPIVLLSYHFIYTGSRLNFVLLCFGFVIRCLVETSIKIPR